jgi:hypothetical protein
VESLEPPALGSALRQRASAQRREWIRHKRRRRIAPKRRWWIATFRAGADAVSGASAVSNHGVVFLSHKP